MNFTDYGFDGSGSELKPYIIENYSITITEENGIYITTSSDSNLVNNTCTNNLNGIMKSSSSGSSLINNNCSNNSNRGI